VRELSEKLNLLTDTGHRFLSHNSTDDSVASAINSGDTAWILVCTALVLFMTMPGLAFFYAGMTRSKNVLTTIMQSFTITCLITFLWLAWGYSLSFAPAQVANGNPIFGDGSRMWFLGMKTETIHQLAPTIPESVFCMYQLTFAIITAALITGSFADRMKYESMIVFIILWHTLVYCPTAHSVWHPNGFLFQAGVLDFAGGDVVHICSGVSGLVSSIIIGQRKGFGTERFEAHNIAMTFQGMSMLWVGWLGFNGGSALSAGDRAGYAVLNTIIGTAISSLSWMFVEWIMRGKPSVLGMINGAVAGLVSITPGCGFVNPTGAFITGLLGGPFCYFGAQVKHSLGYDDALDAFGVHAVGGIFGGIAVGFFADPDNGGQRGVYYGGLEVGGTQLGKQIYGIIVTIGWAVFMTSLILLAIDHTIGLRVSADDEEKGLDSSIHGETIELTIIPPPTTTESNKENDKVRALLETDKNSPNNNNNYEKVAGESSIEIEKVDCEHGQL